MPHRLPRLVAAVSVTLVLTGAAHAQDDAAALFKEGAAAVMPYIALTDRPRADPHSASAPAEMAKGIDLLARATRAQPDYWQAFWFIGKAYQARNDQAAAYRALKRAYEIQPEQVDVAREYVFEAICTSRSVEAVAAARRIAEAHPSDAGLAANVALALLADRQFDAASEAAARSLRLAPNDPITKRLSVEIAAEKNGKPSPGYCAQ